MLLFIDCGVLLCYILSVFDAFNQNAFSLTPKEVLLMDKKTPLYDTHVKYGGKIVSFGGFALPVQYESGIKQEHMAVRTACGLFDVSHMGEIIVSGPKAVDFLNYILTNDFTDLKVDQARYSPMCNEHGGTVDDLIVYKRGENDYFVVVNAGNRDSDFAWMSTHPKTGDSWRCRDQRPRRYWLRLQIRRSSLPDITRLTSTRRSKASHAFYQEPVTPVRTASRYTWQRIRLQISGRY